MTKGRSSRKKYLEAARELITAESVFPILRQRLRQAGFAGATAASELIFLAVVTRFFSRPISAAPRGESSAGKSYAISHGVAFHPPEAIVRLSSMSDKALIYLTEDLSHRFLVLEEKAALGVGVDANAPYLLRTLLSEGRLVHHVTDIKTRKTIRIEKEGPTGVIFSTAGRIDYELSTRLVEVSIPDSPDLTRAIMEAEARSAEGARPQVDYDDFHALMRFVSLGSHEVVVPYAKRLAAATDPRAVRMRRDFPAVIGLTKASALLHQHNRGRDDGGHIVASLDDYRIVHALVSPTLAEVSERAVPVQVRETVETVDAIYYGEGHLARGAPVTTRELADRLGLTQSSTSRRVTRALALGYLKDAGKGRPGSPRLLLPADSPQEDRAVLPSPDELAD